MAHHKTPFPTMLFLIVTVIVSIQAGAASIAATPRIKGQPQEEGSSPSPSSSSSSEATHYDDHCAGEFQRCTNSTAGECVLIAADCGACSPSANASATSPQYLCPDRTTCVSDFSKCPNLKGTFWDWKLDLDTRVELLANLTTTDEQILQLTNEAPSIPHLYVPAYNWLNDDLHGLKRHRATSFPNGCGLGPSWSKETLREVGDTIAEEARALHHWFVDRGDRAEPGYHNGEGLTIYGPNINLVRDPRWGRSQEVYSEDPCLSSHLARQYVEGMQTQEKGYMKAAACCKHFAVYDLESFPTLRYTYDAEVDGRNLWETYLPVFEACVREAKAAHVMCSYNAVNGVPACAQKPMLDGVLRKKWGFEGFVVSDYDAWAQIYQTHRYCPNMTCAAYTGINAGLDQEGGGTSAIDRLPDAIAAGLVTPERVKESFKRLFRVRFQLGMFDPPSMVPYADYPFSVISDSTHMKRTLNAARKTMCLYKNNNSVLPLNLTEFSSTSPSSSGAAPPKKSKTILVVGPNAAATSWLQGNYAIPPAWGVVSILEGIMNAVCGPSTKPQLDNPGADYTSASNDEDNFVPANSSADCISICASKLNCNYFTFNGRSNRCYMMRNMWNRRETYDATIQSGARIGLALMKRNVSYTTGGGGGGGWPSVPSHDERECSQRCRSEPNCMRFTYDVFEHACYLNPQGNETNPGDHYISGYSPPKCENVIFSEACQGGMQCTKPYGFNDAVKKAEELADVVLTVLGLDQAIESEGHDRTTIDLPSNQYKLVDLLVEVTRAKQIPLLGVFVHGGTMALHDLADQLDAIVDAWYPSQQGGNAFADVLFGKYNPAGRATVTYYKSNVDLPPNLAFQDFYPNATAGLKGYTYRYFNDQVQYPFGHGLSYTSFSYSNFQLTAPPSSSFEKPTSTETSTSAVVANISACDVMNVTVTVSNVGTVDGDEVVQLYLKQLDSPTPVPRIRLVDFERVHIKAGDVVKVTLSVRPRFRTTVYPSRADPILGSSVWVEQGTVRLYVGGRQPTTLLLDDDDVGADVSDIHHMDVHVLSSSNIDDCTDSQTD